MNSVVNWSGPITCWTTNNSPATIRVFRSDRHSGESSPAFTAPGTRPTTALGATMNATGITAATSCNAIPAATMRPPSGRMRRTASRKRMRSRTAEELLVRGANRLGARLRPPVRREQPVLLLFDVRQLRPHEAGDVFGNLLDHPPVRGGEILDMAVDEVAGADAEPAELTEPERNVRAFALVVRQLGPVVVHVEEVGVVELLPPRGVDDEPRGILSARRAHELALEIGGGPPPCPLRSKPTRSRGGYCPSANPPRAILAKIVRATP